MVSFPVRSALICIVLAASTRGFRSNKNQVGAEAPDGALAKWDSYVDNLRAHYFRDLYPGWQEACAPKSYRNQGEYAGVVMLLHGFTACPQQFERLAPELTAKGFVVLAPLSPGHGYNWKEKTRNDGSTNITDMISQMPKKVSEYEAFGKEMNNLMQAFPGEKVLMGMSLGGAIASYVSQQGSYTRTLLAAPMVRTAGIVDAVITVASRYPWRANNVFSWGEGCELERSKGRAGICHFSPNIAKAARDFGQKQANSAKPRKDSSLEVMFVEEDAAVSVNAVTNLAIKYGKDKSSAGACGMDAAVGHSFLSPYDNPTENKFWLNEATTRIADYLGDGTQYPQAGTMTNGWQRCKQTCTARTCRYN